LDITISSCPKENKSY